MKHIYLLVLLLIQGSAFGDILPKGELTKNEEEQIRQLAKRKGITDVATIKAYYIAPTSFMAISAVEKETKIDGKVRYRVLNIYKKGWAPNDRKAKAEDMLGDFAVEDVHQEEFDLFPVGKSEYRINLQDGLSRADAEKILKLLIAGKIAFRTKAASDMSAGDLNISKPFSLSFDKTRKQFWASIPTKDPLCGYSLTFIIENNTLIVSEATLVCA